MELTALRKENITAVSRKIMWVQDMKETKAKIEGSSSFDVESSVIYNDRAVETIIKSRLQNRTGTHLF